MSVLFFDGVDDWVKGDGTLGAWNGTFSVAVLADTDGVRSAGCLWGTHSATTLGWNFYVNSSEQVRLYNLTTDSVGPSINATDDWIIGVSRTTGTTTPRFHIKNLTTGAAWAHSNGSLASANAASAVGGYIKMANCDEASPGSGDIGFGGDVAVVGFWDGINMSDANFEDLSVNRKTSDWRNHSVGQPTVLSNLNTLTPTDQGSAALALTRTGAVLTGSEPDGGWTFDGGAAPAGPPKTFQAIPFMR